MPRKKLMQKVRRIVVKIGTSTISLDGRISDEKLSAIVMDISGLIKKGYEVVLVTSGAIPAGSSALKRTVSSLTIPEKQACASLGQVILMEEYKKKFLERGYFIGQILLTEDDILNRRRYLNARHTFDTLLKLGIIPVVNENDSVVVKEIKFGDNDRLSAHVTGLVNADLLILLSDVDGYYHDFNDKEPVEEIYEITREIIDNAGGSGSEFGTGGMIAKIRAAEIIIRSGEMMIIANGTIPDILNRIVGGEKIGTIFVGRESPLSSRKKWISLGKPSGTLVLDSGAVKAVTEGKKSLLSSGIARCSGDFDMGDFVEMSDESGTVIGKGIVNFNREEMDLIMGMKSDEIREILGSNFFNEVINRDDLIIY